MSNDVSLTQTEVRYTQVDKVAILGKKTGFPLMRHLTGFLCLPREQHVPVDRLQSHFRHGIRLLPVHAVLCKIPEKPV